MNIFKADFLLIQSRRTTCYKTRERVDPPDVYGQSPPRDARAVSVNSRTLPTARTFVAVTAHCQRLI